jgi:NADH-quinone oxidoreductase subunit G
MARIQVDGVAYEVPEGRTLLQALDELGVLMNGVEIPHYCWHPKLSIDGSCRLCQVEVQGLPKLQIACNTPVRDGMVVDTRSERVRAAREGVMELLLLNHPLDCPICDQAGECKLQDYAFAYGVPHSRTREARRPAKKRVELGPTIVFDQERCILCRRCVRFCREVPGTGELGIFARGDESVVETFPGVALDNPYSMNVADICPVGALTTKDFRFKIRVWFLEDVPGLCTGCANGCNVFLGVANNKVYRYVPRRNDLVNDTWICDAGRLSYREVGAPDRVQRALVRGELGVLEAVGLSAALDAAAARLRGVRERFGGAALGGVASAQASNEDLFVFRRFLDALGAGASALAVRRGEADRLLIKAEKGPNGAGARALGFGDPADLVAGVRSGSLRGLVVMGHDLAASGALEVSELAPLEALVLLALRHGELERAAHVVLPVRHAAEKAGTYVNHAGRVQRTWPALEPAFEALADGELLTRLAARLGLPGFDGGFEPAEVFGALARELPAFAGLSLDGLPAEGAALSSGAAGA